MPDQTAIDLGFTAQEVADKLGIHRASVYRLIAAGELEHHDYPTIGKRVTEAQLQRFLDRYVVPATRDDDATRAVS